MAAPVTQLAQYTRFDVPVQQAMRRSQYLAEALKQLEEGSASIRSAPELGVRLLADALMQRQSRKADEALARAIEEQNKSQNNFARSLLGPEDDVASLASVIGAATPQAAPEPAPTAQPPQITMPTPQAPAENGQPPQEAFGVAAPGAPLQAVQQSFGASAPPAAPGGPGLSARTQQRSPLGATPDEVRLVEMLLSNPQTQAQGQQMAMEIASRAAAPVKNEFVTMNGVPVGVNPYGQQGPVPIPEQARDMLATAESLGIPNPGGYYSLDPYGRPTQVYSPPQGYGIGPDGQMAPMAGGPADPYRPQTPPSGYTYTQDGRGMAPIRGGPDDPTRTQTPPAGYQWANGRQEVVPGGPQDPSSPANRTAAIQAQQQRFNDTMANATKLHRSHQAVAAGYEQQNGPGDIAMINGLQRMIDDGVVREGDVALQLRAQGINGTIASLRGQLTSAGFFSPEIRNQIKTAADSLYGGMMPTYRDQVMPYRQSIDATYGPGTFDAIVPPALAETFGWGGGRTRTFDLQGREVGR